jgi:hypothetical protein
MSGPNSLLSWRLSNSSHERNIQRAALTDPSTGRCRSISLVSAVVERRRWAHIAYYWVRRWQLVRPYLADGNRATTTTIIRMSMTRYDGTTEWSYNGHAGIDYPTGQQTGYTVVAATSGVVAFVGWENPNDQFRGFGYYVRVWRAALTGASSTYSGYNRAAAASASATTSSSSTRTALSPPPRFRSTA